MIDKTDTIIDGIGDEVIIGMLMIIFATLPIGMAFYIWGVRRNTTQVIHPESEETVQRARDRLREQDRIPPERISTRETDQESQCPICLSHPTYAVETNCGHVFCGNCVITYWQHGSWHGTVRCPVCRQNVSIMLFLFSEQERNNASAEKEHVISNINNYNRRFSGEPRELMEYVRDLPMLLRHLAGEFFSLSGLILMFRLRVVICFLFALVYFISPLDLIPEAIFGLLGFLDDFFVLLLLTIYLSIIYRQVVAMRSEDNS